MRINTGHNFIGRLLSSAAVIAIMLVTAFDGSVLRANNLCPFCSAVAMTFSEQLETNDIAVVAKLIEIPPPNDDPDAEFPKAKFEILKILKGKKFVGEGMTFKTQLVGTYPVGQKFLILGVDPPQVAWSTPMKASDRVFDYLAKIQELPEKGFKRLLFFQKFFEDEESVLAFDAYDEFARAPYQDLIDMKDQMERDKLLGWITNPETSINRRRLYFTMLGVCGKEEDTKLLEELIKSKSRKKRAGLDALIACYLNLRGEAGVDLIEETFLKDKEVDYVDTLAAVSALRFHGTEVDFVSKERIVKAIRHLLDRPKMADMIIPDLARWEDWSVMERLVQMFKDADDDSNWLRVPVITYLRACPHEKAKEYIEELRKIDPESVERADFFLGFDQEGDDWGDEEESTTDDSKKDSGSEDSDDASGDKESHVVKRVSLDQEQESESDTAKGTFASEKDADAASCEDPVEETQTVTSGEPKVAKIVAPKANPEPAVFVSSNAEMVPSTVNTQATQSSNPPLPVAATAVPNLTLSIIFIPMAVSALIFVLLWSVVSGWFERLIF